MEEKILRTSGGNIHYFYSDIGNDETMVFLHGLTAEKDITGKVRAYNRKWADNTGYKLVWIENAAHNSNDDNPEAVNKSIEKFLDLLS